MLQLVDEIRKTLQLLRRKKLKLWTNYVLKLQISNNLNLFFSVNNLLNTEYEELACSECPGRIDSLAQNMSFDLIGI